jgi:uncharacterized membrane protein YgcG
MIVLLFIALLLLAIWAGLRYGVRPAEPGPPRRSRERSRDSRISGDSSPTIGWGQGDAAHPPESREADIAPGGGSGGGGGASGDWGPDSDGGGSDGGGSGGD